MMGPIFSLAAFLPFWSSGAAPLNPYRMTWLSLLYLRWRFVIIAILWTLPVLLALAL